MFVAGGLLFLASLGGTAAAQDGAAGLDALALQLGCDRAPGYRGDGLASGGASGEFLRCCLAILDRNHLQNPAAGDAAGAAARQLEAGLLSRLAAIGQADRPRACRAPASRPPPVSWPLPGPGPDGGEDPAGGWPGLSVSLGFGAPIAGADTRIPTGAGTAQDFRSNSWSSPLLDARVSVPLRLLSGGGAAGRSAGNPFTSPILSFGYSRIGSTVTSLTNRGGAFDGVVNSGIRGSTTIDRLYVAGALAIPLIRGARAAGSLPGTDLMLGASLGYSMLATSVPAAGFSRSQSGVDYGLSAGLRLRVAPKLTVEPGVEYIFNPAGNPANDARLLGMLRVTFAF